MVRPPVGGRWIVRRVGEQDRRGAGDSCAVRRGWPRGGAGDGAGGARAPPPRGRGGGGGGGGGGGWGVGGGGGAGRARGGGGGVRGERAGEQRCGYEVVEAADEPRVVDAIHGESRERPVPRAAHE